MKDRGTPVLLPGGRVFFFARIIIGIVVREVALGKQMSSILHGLCGSRHQREGK